MRGAHLQPNYDAVGALQLNCALVFSNDDVIFSHSLHPFIDQSFSAQYMGNSKLRRTIKLLTKENEGLNMQLATCFGSKPNNVRPFPAKGHDSDKDLALTKRISCLKTGIKVSHKTHHRKQKGVTVLTPATS